ncbi:hypothetical protein DY240_10805, partial [Jiangella rhizosphaerae]
MSRPSRSAWLFDKVRRYPVVIVCAFAATLGITLGNMLVPSIDHALGINPFQSADQVIASPGDEPGRPSASDDPGDSPSEGDGDGGSASADPGSDDEGDGGGSGGGQSDDGDGGDPSDDPEAEPGDGNSTGSGGGSGDPSDDP